MDKKGFLQISFAWLFSIIVGIFILSLAIYGTVKFIQTEERTLDAKTGKEIGILLNPLETSFQNAQSSSLDFPTETRIYNKCNNNFEFGRQIIQVSQKSFSKWTETDIDVGFSNKYIFSDDYVEGKKFYVFSKPFDFPFKITDLIYITSSLKDYCFVGAPEDIEEELESLGQENIFTKDCPEESVKVCFTEEDCDINVDYDRGYVSKRGDNIYFEGDGLMYGAIFSDKEIYECQVKRLMQRIEQLTILYRDKANFVASKGCDSNLNQDLVQLNNLAKSFSNSNDLNNIAQLVKDMGDKNEVAQCRLW